MTPTTKENKMTKIEWTINKCEDGCKCFRMEKVRLGRCGCIGAEEVTFSNEVADDRADYLAREFQILTGIKHRVV